MYLLNQPPNLLLTTLLTVSARSRLATSRLATSTFPAPGVRKDAGTHTHCLHDTGKPPLVLLPCGTSLCRLGRKKEVKGGRGKGRGGVGRGGVGRKTEGGGGGGNEEERKGEREKKL